MGWHTSTPRTSETMCIPIVFLSKATNMIFLIIVRSFKVRAYVNMFSLVSMKANMKSVTKGNAKLQAYSKWRNGKSNYTEKSLEVQI